MLLEFSVLFTESIPIFSYDPHNKPLMQVIITHIRQMGALRLRDGRFHTNEACLPDAQ